MPRCTPHFALLPTGIPLHFATLPAPVSPYFPRLPFSQLSPPPASPSVPLSLHWRRSLGAMAQVWKKRLYLRHWSAQKPHLRRRSPSQKHTCAKNRHHLHHHPRAPAPPTPNTCTADIPTPPAPPRRPAPPFDPRHPRRQSTYHPGVIHRPFPLWDGGLPTIFATDSCSSPKQRASCATEVRNER